MSIINLKLSNSNYNIHVESGLLQDIGKLISQWYKEKSLTIITDSTVESLYGDIIFQSLFQCGYKVNKIVVSPGEQTKSLDSLNYIYNKLAETGATRSSLILAFGGGVIGDLAGFAAATYMRGVPYVQIPTTVMSQLDSSIGGKTAVNIAAGKNLAGCFYQPKAVYIDPQVLDTLPDRAFSDGLAEAVKYGCIKDLELFNMLQSMQNFEVARQNINEIIYKCVSIKCEIVSADELDKGERMLLNFGHTIGHGIEKYFDYDTYTHGEAVGLGMQIITKNSEAMGITEHGTTEAITELLNKFRLPINYNQIDRDKLIQLINIDKKSEDNHINIILLKKIGYSFIEKISKDALISFVK